MYKRYIIQIGDYRTNSGGVRVMHQLAQNLAKKGYETFVTTEKLMPEAHYRTFNGEIKDTDIVVYGDRVTGNPLKAKNIYRYLLHFPEHWQKDIDIDPNKTFLFTELLQVGKYKNCKILYTPVIEQDLFVEAGYKNNRGLKTVKWLGKGKDTADMLTYNLFKTDKVITSNDPGTREAVANLLAQSSRFYSFDMYTLLIYESALAGCLPVIIPDGTFTRKQYENTIIGLNGIAFGIKDIQRALDTKKDFLPAYNKQIHISEKQLDKFIKITQQ